MKAVGYITVFILLCIVGPITNGITVSYLWEWFIVPPFGVPRISMMQAAGLSLVVSHFTMRQDIKKDERKFGEIMAAGFGWMLMRFVLGLGCGWILHQFV